eukprot:COSAG04_NODE_498_length_13385_cov_46.317853_16_plen_37_part_00
MAMRPFPGRGRFMQVPALFEFGHVRALHPLAIIAAV